jgi:phage baseplate assembly protein W
MTSYTAPDVEIRRRRLLGVGLRADLISSADIARDIAVVPSAGGKDLATVSSIDNLTQCLAIGLTTLRGSDVFNQRFGFLGLTPLATQTSPVLAREGVRSAVAEFLASDPRVRRIIDLQAGNPMTAPSGAGRRTLEVRVSFEAVSGEATMLTTGGLASGGDWGAIGATGASA